MKRDMKVSFEVWWWRIERKDQDGSKEEGKVKEWRKKKGIRSRRGRKEEQMSTMSYGTRKSRANGCLNVKPAGSTKPPHDREI